MRPLYRELTTIAPGNTSHPGLVFDKYIDKWRDPPSTKPDDGAKQKFFQEIARRVADIASEVNKRLLATHERRRTLVLARGGRLYTAKTASRLIVGLGSGHPFEAGLTWHPTLGVPYLPGSSVKGMIRAWNDPRIKNVHACGWGDPSKWETMKHLFGDPEKLGAGTIIVFEAVPTRCPALAVDIMTPHYGPYYQDPAQNAPGDWHNPTPIPFLTVAEDQEFEFALAPRCLKDADANEDLDRAKGLLEEALQLLGAGGKTAVGYGRFESFTDQTDAYRQALEQRRDEERRRQEHERGAAGLANLTGLERELAEFELMWRAAQNQQQVEQRATEIFKQLLHTTIEVDRLKIAQSLKSFYTSINKWQGRHLTEKQQEKVQTIRGILGE